MQPEDAVTFYLQGKLARAERNLRRTNTPTSPRRINSRSPFFRPQQMRRVRSLKTAVLRSNSAQHTRLAISTGTHFPPPPACFCIQRNVTLTGYNFREVRKQKWSKQL